MRGPSDSQPLPVHIGMTQQHPGAVVLAPEAQDDDMPPRFSRRAADAPLTVEGLQAENDYLASVIAGLEKRLPTDEELAYLRNRKEQDDHAAWVVKVIKANAPWLMALLSMAGTLTYWLLTHSVSIKDK